MTILYFTATGNSLYVAKELGRAELISIPRAIKENKRVFSDEKIGVVCPIYGWNPMPYVVDFLRTAEFRTDYLFAILTYGAFSGNAERSLWNLGRRMGKSFDYINKVVMPDNYLPLFSMEAQKKTEMTKHIEERVARIRNDISSGVIREPGVSAAAPVSYLLSKARAFNTGKGVAATYTVSDQCVSCGTCAAVCPMGNIRIQDARPVFSDRCASCLACIQNCPVKAIHMSGERSGARFRNSHITVEEIKAANNVL